MNRWMSEFFFTKSMVFFYSRQYNALERRREFSSNNEISCRFWSLGLVMVYNKSTLYRGV